MDIVCTFDPGNPARPGVPKLTRDGTDLNIENKSNPTGLVHTIPAVGCRDSGNVTCHGFGRAKSAQLIVDCKYVCTRICVRFD